MEFRTNYGKNIRYLHIVSISLLRLSLKLKVLIVRVVNIAGYIRIINIYDIIKHFTILFSYASPEVSIFSEFIAVKYDQ